MSTEHLFDERAVLFPPTFAGDSVSEGAKSLWTVLRRALDGEISLDCTWLVRWDEPALQPGGRPVPLDNDARARSLVHSISSQPPTGTVCLRYDTTAILVLASDPTWAGSHVVTETAQASAASNPGDNLEFWQAVAVSDDGLHFRRFVTDAQSAHPEPLPASGGTPRTSKLVLSDAEYTFFPLRDVTTNQLLAYLCQAVWSGPGSKTFTEGSMEIRGASPEQLAAIDLALFRAGIGFVQNALDNFSSVNVVIPVHCGVFARSEAAARLFETVGREIWPVFENVFFELIPGPSSEPFNHVTMAVTQLDTYGRPVMLRVDSTADDLSEIPVVDWLSVGFEQATSDDTDPARLSNFVSRVCEIGCAAHILGLRATPDTVAAINAGFTYVGSDAIAPALTGADEDERQVDPADILRAILSSKGPQ